MDKYQTALMMIRPVIEATERRDHAEANRTWDDLYSFIYANFAAPGTTLTHINEGPSWNGRSNYAEIAHEARSREDWEAEIVECQWMLSHNAQELVEHLHARPPEYSDRVFPVAIARYLLCDCNVPVDTVLLKTYDEFHRRYAVMIIEGAARNWDRNYGKKA